MLEDLLNGGVEILKSRWTHERRDDPPVRGKGSGPSCQSNDGNRISLFSCYLIEARLVHDP
jgi:hypothetical protein